MSVDLLDEQTKQRLFSNLKQTHVEIKPSKLHGVGLFTTKPFKRGDVIFVHETSADQVCTVPYKTLRNLGLTEKAIATLRKWYAHTNEYIELPRNYQPNMLHIVSLMNHSPNPTLEYHDHKYYAKRDITVGKELTLNYTVGNYISGNLDFKAKATAKATKTQRRRKTIRRATKRRATKRGATKRRATKRRRLQRGCSDGPGKKC